MNARPDNARPDNARPDNASPDKLRRDALDIWHAGLEAAGSERLMRAAVRIEGTTLQLAGETFDLARASRIAVVGAGKAGAGMAAALEEILGHSWCEAKQLTGWINVPADCVRPLRYIHLHAARPAGVNEPTAAGVAGSEEILRLVASLTAADLCVCLISGGGSALLPAPAGGVSLADKQALTRHLSAAGANIAQLNAVRKQLSRVKGGRLARACRAGTLVSLIISDVPGDPLDVIASGPTVPDSSTPQQALAVLEQYGARQAGVSPAVFDYLQRQRSGSRRTAPARSVHNLVIGNNAVAVDAAGVAAERLGYSHAMAAATELEGDAEQVGRHLAEMALHMRRGGGPDCLITGGEPVVKLAPPAERGLGGRNQQLVLAAAQRLAEDGAAGIALLSGGTDGEDGPTDAAGAVLDERLLSAAREKGLDAGEYLRRNDAYHFFQPLEGLIFTGPTHSNVCDVRVAVVRRP